MYFHSDDDNLSDLLGFISRQLAAMWGESEQESFLLKNSMRPALARILANYRHVKENLPRYSLQGQPAFSPLNSDQYCVFLHYLRDEVYRLESSSPLPDKLFALNKMLHSVDFYSAALPEHFMVSHPLGAVIGRAAFPAAGHCLIYQQVTIGGSYGEGGVLHYPTIGNHVILYAGAKLVGRAEIGDFSILALGTCVKDEIIPPRSLVFGTSPHLVIRPLSLKRYEELSPYVIK